VSKKSWYKRKHQFTPYTKADGQAVSDEFDAIQTSFERIPEMRDDGRGFKESPLIPEPTDPMHPVPLKMLTETEKSVNNARDDVIAKAQQVAQNTQSVATNTLTATQKADTATQAAASAQSSQQEASNSENMAHKWAANPVDETVQGDKYSAYHYATKAAQSATTASSAAITSKSNADIATNKAEEAAQSAKRAESLANGEIEYEKVLNVPSADTQTKGVVQLTSSLESGSESLGLTAKAGKYISELIGNVKTSLSNFILKTSLSSEVNVESEDSVATSLAVKKAYDKAVEANNNADNKVPKNGDTTINGTLKVKNTSGGWSAYQFETSQGFWQLEVHPNSHENANRRFNMVYVPNSGNRVYLLFPALGNNGEVVAYQSWAVNKAGDSMTGILYSVGISSKHYGYGNYANQYTSGAPFLVNAEGSQDRDTYHPFVKGLVRSRGRYGAGFSFGYTTKQGAGDGFGRGVIHLVEDNGSNKTWIFEHNGDFVAPSDVLTARGKSLNNSTQLSDFSYQKIGNFEVRKYPDGTMIQTNVVNFRGGYSHGTVYSFNWAVSFVEAPAVFGSNKAVEDFSFVDKNQMGIKTKSNGSTYYYYLYDPGGEQGDWDMQFLAIGRWKR
jgi:hypothetical protein